CGYNQISNLPALPNTLGYLDCSSNPLGNLPALPDSLNTLNCDHDQLTSIPTLPLGLKSLFCRNNQLSTLPVLPNGLRTLKCGFNLFSTLPLLPNSLTRLECESNQLTALPTLPGGISLLYCHNNQLTGLPTLPSALQTFHCYDNQLTSLPSLPQTLSTLYAYNNQLSSLPELPDTMSSCNVRDNPLACLPKLKLIYTLTFTGTQVTCVPNYGTIYNSSPDLSTIPLCNIFNANGCEILSNISGKTYYDDNSNCTGDTGDTVQRNVKVELWSGANLLQQAFTGGKGLYSFDTDSFTNYELSIDTSILPFYVSCPANSLLYDTITVTDSLHYNRDFALECKPGFDLIAFSVYAWRFRPARPTNVNIHAGDFSNFFGVRCAAGISGAVTVTLNGPATYISSSGGLTPIVSGNVLTYNIADFGAVNFLNDFNIIVQTDTNAVLGSQVCFTVSVTPTVGDNNPANNTLTHCFTVVGSFDPNDKQVYPVSDVDVNGEQWLTYTVNFQNTGTDTAIHIYVTDTLDADLDASTFQLLAYSHQPMVQLKENAVRFNFPNIMLVDSHANEPLSHGYVQYKIKIKDNKPVGTVIDNTAFIYFDFNAPVVTNTTSNTIAVISDVSEIRNQKSEIRIYPNPASNIVTLEMDEIFTGGTVTVYDVTGRRILTANIEQRIMNIEVSELANGVYIAEVKMKDGSVKRRWVKM
ncbi:MAG: T9SS type A sorting domain-containing protein, partial [Bacteroidota bacterium]